MVYGFVIMFTIYALADKENNRLIYVEINFCDYFIDIDYEKIIDEKKEEAPIWRWFFF